MLPRPTTHLDSSPSHKNHDSFWGLKFGKCEHLRNILVDSVKWHVINIWVNKQHLDLHLLFSHNQDSYKYLLRGQNHRSSQHCSQIKGCFWLPGHDECTIIKQFHNQTAFPYSCPQISCVPYPLKILFLLLLLLINLIFLGKLPVVYMKLL